MIDRPPRVFISYAQETEDDHSAWVLALANRLRDDGVEAVIDRYIRWPAKGWRPWASEQIEKADWVLVVCTEEYWKQFNGKAAAGSSRRGVRWESQHITQALYDDKFSDKRFVPVLPPAGDEDFIPLPLKDYRNFRLDDQYDDLYRLLTDQPAPPAPKVGKLRHLPPLPVPVPEAFKPEPRAIATPTAQAEERRVNARILHGQQVRRSFVAGADNTIRCWIGLPEADIASATIPSPDRPLELTVQLYWTDGHGEIHNDSRPMLLVPERTARTGDCDLRLHVPEGERYVSADIVFLYGGRVFEAVRLEAFALALEEPEEPHHQIRILVQASRRQVIEFPDSPPVDTVVMRQAAVRPGGALPAMNSPSLRRFGSGGGQHFDLHHASQAIEWLNDTLHATQTLIVRKQAVTIPVGGVTPPLVDEFDENDTDARALVLDMARHGTGLYKELCDQGFTDPGERIQILCEDADDHVPLEFVYDRGYPSSKAQWCGAGLAALKIGANTCPECQLPGQEDELGNVAVLCPYGFWSMRKVIERVSPTADGHMSDPGATRRLLAPMTSVAFASSHLVPELERQATQQALKKHFDKVLLADDWLQWRRAVREHPALLIVLPHHGIASRLDYLEIGDANLDEALGKLSAAQIDERVVNPDALDPGPIVLLLGCQTARASETGYADLASRIHRQHASIVLGTLAQILGRHAGPIAREFALTLANLTTPDTDFGDVMLQVRRRMLARGCLIAMCLIARGDALWRIQTRPVAPPHLKHTNPSDHHAQS